MIAGPRNHRNQFPRREADEAAYEAVGGEPQKGPHLAQLRQRLGDPLGADPGL